MASQREETGRAELKRMIDGLPNSEIHAARRYLQFLSYHNDTLAWSLDHAPYDDEPITEEDWEAISEANEDIAAGRVVSHGQIKKELGL